jgi:hypothetical protein
MYQNALTALLLTTMSDHMARTAELDGSKLMLIKDAWTTSWSSGVHDVMFFFLRRRSYILANRS